MVTLPKRGVQTNSGGRIVDETDALGQSVMHHSRNYETGAMSHVFIASYTVIVGQPTAVRVGQWETRVLATASRTTARRGE